MLKRHMMDSIHLDHDHMVSLFYAVAVVVGTVALLTIAMFLSEAVVPQDPETQILGFLIG